MNTTPASILFIVDGRVKTGEAIVGKRREEDGTPVPQRGRPKDPERRVAILNAARDLFLEHGVVVVSMDTIASAAGVSKRTIYSHFTDKEALLQAVMKAAAAGFQRLPENPDLTDSADLRRMLVDFGVGLLRIHAQPAVLDLGRLLMSECRRHPKLTAEFHKFGPEATLHQLTALLARAAEKRFLEMEDPLVTAEQLLSMWTGPLNLLQLGLAPQPTEQDIASYVSQCVEVILRAYAPSQGPGPRRTQRRPRTGPSGTGSPA